MKNYRIRVAGVERELPFVDISDDMAFASFVVISDTELISAAAPLLARKIGHCDAIVTAEAKGIALAYEISRLLGMKSFLVARKSEKTYMKDTVSVPVHSCCWTGPTGRRSRGRKSASSTTWSPPASPSPLWSGWWPPPARRW